MTTAVRTLSILTILAGAAAVLTGCGGLLGEKFYDYTPPTPPDMQLRAVSKLMTGSFSSAEQAAADPEYRDIRLEMSQIWPARSDGVWLYVEQSAADAPAPYRQRVYRLTRKDADSYVSDVYTLPDETRVFLGHHYQRDEVIVQAGDAPDIGQVLRLETEACGHGLQVRLSADFAALSA